MASEIYASPPDLCSDLSCSAPTCVRVRGRESARRSDFTYRNTIGLPLDWHRGTSRRFTDRLVKFPMALCIANMDDPSRGQPRQESSACSCAGQTDAGASSRTKRRPRHRGLEDRGRQARPEGLDAGTAGKGGWGPPERPAALTIGPVPDPVRAAGDRPCFGVPTAPSRCAEAARPNRRTQFSFLITPSRLSAPGELPGAGRDQAKETLSVETLVSAHHIQAPAKTYAQSISDKPEQT